MVYENHEFCRLTEMLARRFPPRTQQRNILVTTADESTWKSLQTHPLTSIPNSEVQEKKKTKPTTETRRQHARRRRPAAFLPRPEIGSELSTSIDFPQDAFIKYKLETIPD